MEKEINDNSKAASFKIGIVNYGAGNLFSLGCALERQNIAYGMINKADDFDLYSHVIIPGVGHAGAAMSKLKASGLADSIKLLKKPVLGICVGMQLLTAHSEEGNSALLDLFPLKTRLFDKEQQIKIPHMGWNNVDFKDNKLFHNILNQTQFYFVHSYFIEFNPIFDIASVNYGCKFSAAIQKDNFFGVQFHPEKSGAAGEQLLKNFANLTP
ncbi:imidazole glycerol phosphate synthase subunit HisH [Pedobacter sp.]|uniref:imidazole glycerol phosphate synthase subunit HisH n=1 Tax=Pedobacter sp. TaxID=1411316 RepID=UPI00396CF903